MGFESSFAGNGLVKIDNSKSGLLIDRLEVQIKAIENVVNELLFFGGSDRMSFADVVTDWAGPTRTLVLLAANSQSRGLKLEQPGGIIGISKLYELLRPLTIVPELKKVVEEFYAGEKLISFLQVAFVKARGESFAKTLTGLQNYSEISELPEILEVREVLVCYFDVHFRFFEPFRLR